jgi:O-antigen/teichoic acid export membrane protein
MIKKLLGSQLRLNMASGTLTTIINVVAMAFAYPVYLHFLGYETYGVWLVLATVLSFAQLGNLGIGQAVMKLVAEEHGRGDIKGIQQYVTTALLLLCISGAVVLALILLLRNQIIAAFNLSDENARTVLWLLPYIGILSIYVFIVQVMNSTLSGLGRMDIANYAQSFGRIVAVTVAAILLYNGRGVESLLIGNTLSYVFVHVVSLIYILRIAKIRILQIGNLNAQYCKRILLFGGGVFGGTVVSMLGSPFNKLMLSRYAGVSTIPVYEIAFNGAMQFRNLIEAGFRALMPEVSRVAAEITSESINRIVSLNRRAMKLILFFGIPMYTMMIVLITPLLRIWLREDFVQSTPPAFQIMLIATFVNMLGVPSFYILMGTGYSRDIFASRSITWLMNVFLVTTIAVTNSHLSTVVISFCLLISWSLSSSYLLWRFQSVVRNHRRVLSHEVLMSDVIDSCKI